jgi:hypothetical protein
MGETLEDRNHKRDYRLWEGSVRASGRDEKSWHRACEMVTQSTALAKP